MKRFNMPLTLIVIAVVIWSGLASPSSTFAQTGTAVYVNMGAAANVVVGAATWGPCPGTGCTTVNMTGASSFTIGSAITGAVAPASDAIYQTSRRTPTNGSYSFSVAVQPGSYEIRYYFARSSSTVRDTGIEWAFCNAGASYEYLNADLPAAINTAIVVVPPYADISCDTVSTFTITITGLNGTQGFLSGMSLIPVVTPTATSTATSTATGVPPTATNTATGVPPTATNTATGVPPTATATPEPPTATPELPTATPELPTATPELPTVTLTYTPMIVASPTSTSTSIPTVELALTGVLTAGMVLIQTQGSAWSITGDQASMWWSLAMMVFVSAIILLLRNQFMQ